MPDDASRNELDALWRATQERLEASVPESTYRLWLEPLEAAGTDGETLYLARPEGVRAWSERRYSALIAEALGKLDSPLRRVSFAAAVAGGQTLDPHPELNPNYTFERFVIGPGNRLAHGAALAVAEAPSEAYNPLFLHGPPGLGKTHLLAAIANYLRDNAPTLSVRYTTAESFTNEFVAALKSSGSEGFKVRYRDIDVLLIDDVQFLEGKPATEEEFFHTFNALYESGSQLGPLRRSDPQRAFDPRLAPARPIRVGPDDPRRAAQPRHPPDRPAAAGRGGGRRDRRRRRPGRAREPDRRQRATAPRRPHPGSRACLADGPAAQQGADRRSGPGGSHPATPPRSRRSSSGSPSASASPAPSSSAPAAPPSPCGPDRWRSTSPATSPTSRFPRSVASMAGAITPPCSTRCGGSKRASTRTPTLADKVRELRGAIHNPVAGER